MFVFGNPCFSGLWHHVLEYDYLILPMTFIHLLCILVLGLSLTNRMLMTLFIWLLALQLWCFVPLLSM